jgi:hypothetical protein
LGLGLRLGVARVRVGVRVEGWGYRDADAAVLLHGLAPVFPALSLPAEKLPTPVSLS